MKVRILLLIFIFSSVLAFAQRRPDQFTEETSPTNANFEVYSQKNGQVRRASLLNLKKYFTPEVETTAINYVPTATGNTANLMEFVKTAGDSIYYIDAVGSAFLLRDPVGNNSESLASSDLTQLDEVRVYNQNNQKLKFKNSKGLLFTSDSDTIHSDPYLFEYKVDNNLVEDYGAGNHYGFRSQTTMKAGSKNDYRVGALLGQIEVLSSNPDSLHHLVGAYGNVKNSGSGIVDIIYGVYAEALTNGSGNVGSQYIVEGGLTHTGSGTVTTAGGYKARAFLQGVTNSFKAFEFPAGTFTGLTTDPIFLANDNSNSKSYSLGKHAFGTTSGAATNTVVIQDLTTDPLKIVGLVEDNTPSTVMTIDANGVVKSTPSSFFSNGSVTFSNGLTDGKLGGTLIEDTNINTSSFDISFTGAGNVGVGTSPGTTKFRVQGGTNNIATYSRGSSTGYTNYFINTSSGGSAYIQNTSSGLGLKIDTKNNYLLDGIYREGVENSSNTVGVFLVTTSNTASDNFGGDFLFQLERANGSTKNIGKMSWAWENSTTEQGKFAFETQDAGAVISNHLNLIGASNTGLKKTEITGNLIVSDTIFAEIDYDNTSSGLSASTVQSAIDEVNSNNFYSNDGTLTGNRTVTLGTNSVTFQGIDGSNVNSSSFENDVNNFSITDGTNTSTLTQRADEIKIGTAPLKIVNDALDQIIITDNETNSTTKNGGVGLMHYTNTEEPVSYFYAQSGAAFSNLRIGGGSSDGNAATSIRFYTAANNTTTVGTNRMEIQDDGDIVIFSELVIDDTNNVRLLSGSGTPEGNVTAGIGSTYSRTDGGASTSFYVKESGTGNTGWVAK